MRERELEFSPENIKGRQYRVPTITGEGSGFGFTFDNLHLPIGWQEKISKVTAVRNGGLENFLNKECEGRGLPPGEVVYDPKTGLPLELSVETDPTSKISLITEFPDREKGLYRGENVNQLMVAIVLQRSLIGFFNLFKADNQMFIPYIDGSDEYGYYSRFLQLPEGFLETGTIITDANYQASLALLAKDIASQFGLTLKGIWFDKQMGILGSVDVLEGDACGYDLDERSRRYEPHNVDTPYQAVVLHGVVASFINHLLRSKDGQA